MLGSHRARTLFDLADGYQLEAALALPDLTLVAGRREGLSKRLPGVLWHRAGSTQQLAPECVLWRAEVGWFRGQATPALFVTDLHESPRGNNVTLRTLEGSTWRTSFSRECSPGYEPGLSLSFVQGAWYLLTPPLLVRVEVNGTSSLQYNCRSLHAFENTVATYENTSLVCRDDHGLCWTWTPETPTHVESVVFTRSGGLIAIAAPLSHAMDEPQRWLIRIDRHTGRELARSAVMGALHAQPLGDAQHIVGRERDAALFVIDLDTFSSRTVASRVGEPLLAGIANPGIFTAAEGRAAWLEGESLMTWSATEGTVERAHVGSSFFGKRHIVSRVFLAANHLVWAEDNAVRAIELPRLPALATAPSWQPPTNLSAWRERWEFASIPPYLRAVLEAYRDRDLRRAATRVAAAPSTWPALTDDEVNALAFLDPALVARVREARATQPRRELDPCQRCGRATLVALSSDVLNGNLSTGASDCDVRWEYRCSSCHEETTKYT
jgi:hypothetical protein